MGWIHNGYAVCDLCGLPVYNARKLEAWELHSYSCPAQNVKLHSTSIEEFLRQRETGLVRLSFEDFLREHGQDRKHNS